MIKDIRKKINHYIAYPNVLSLQTLSQSLQLCCDLYQYSEDKKWARNATNIVNTLIKYQNSDGGFGIGYDWFGAGKMHKRKSSTSPELEELYAIMEYANIFKDSQKNKDIKAGINWILNNLYDIDHNRIGLAYDPQASKEVFINNGVSFGIKCIAFYSKFSDINCDLLIAYHGMIRFLESELEEDPKYKGRFWRYFYQQSKDIPQTELGTIIENHHIGQQLEAHCVSQKYLPMAENLDIIRDVAIYLSSIQEKDIIGYSANIERSYLDIWGYASCIRGFTEASNILNIRKYICNAEKIASWILNNAWNGEYFYPVIDLDGEILTNDYFPRSDAWVLHSLAHMLKEDIVNREEIYNICEKGYTKLNSVKFKGKDKFAWDRKRRVITNFEKYIR